MITAVVLAEGHAAGPPIALAEPLSFWGGFDAASGRVIDRRHPDVGRSLTGKILVMPAVRGSSSGSSVLAEAIRIGTAPLGIILGERDAILPVGAMVAAALYGKSMPIVVVRPDELGVVAAAAAVEILAGPAARIVLTCVSA
ncbi:MAG TPA: DUF126 domain-containing protein [Hyphomicrobiaceae bacterium]|nr:DUF126 domain-containing protein [Hyphomicrobiaceae bacterium]